MAKLRMGLIGCGAIGQLAHIPHLIRYDEKFELIALSDVHRPTLDAVADHYHIAGRHTDWRDLIAQQDVDAVMSNTTVAAFQSSLERGPHAAGHIAVGGTMGSSSSPADPIFWMHHANIDRLWSIWAQSHPTKKPGNLSANLLPSASSGIISGKVRDVLDLSPAGLDYRYV